MYEEGRCPQGRWRRQVCAFARRLFVAAALVPLMLAAFASSAFAVTFHNGTPPNNVALSSSTVTFSVGATATAGQHILPAPNPSYARSSMRIDGGAPFLVGGQPDLVTGWVWDDGAYDFLPVIDDAQATFSYTTTLDPAFSHTVVDNRDRNALERRIHVHLDVPRGSSPQPRTAPTATPATLTITARPRWPTVPPATRAATARSTHMGAVGERQAPPAATERCATSTLCTTVAISVSTSATTSRAIRRWSLRLHVRRATRTPRTGTRICQARRSTTRTSSMPSPSLRAATTAPRVMPAGAT